MDIGIALLMTQHDFNTISLAQKVEELDRLQSSAGDRSTRGHPQVLRRRRHKPNYRPTFILSRSRYGYQENQTRHRNLPRP